MAKKRKAPGTLPGVPNTHVHGEQRVACKGAVNKCKKTRDKRKNNTATEPPLPPPAAPKLSAPASRSSKGAALARQEHAYSEELWRLETGVPSRPRCHCPAGTSLLDKMRQRLQGGRFRWLNERLYTSDSSEAVRMMDQEPELYEEYHVGGFCCRRAGPPLPPGCAGRLARSLVPAAAAGDAAGAPTPHAPAGFREQTKGWPVQPVDLAISWLKSKPSSWVVADLGCGDARLAASVPHRVRSFDLVATAPGVEACNLAGLPLGDGSVNAAVRSSRQRRALAECAARHGAGPAPSSQCPNLATDCVARLCPLAQFFCLSLMGTDYGQFIEEAHRVLADNGWLWIAEVQSRCPNVRPASPAAARPHAGSLAPP
jgi:ribosomal RNA-processing protein 8